MDTDFEVALDGLTGAIWLRGRSDTSTSATGYEQSATRLV